MRTAGALLAAPALFGVALGQPSHANPIDPRHHFDERCPKAVTLDATGTQRDPSSTSSYLWTPMAASATVEECARLCCGDWSCEAFAFVKPKAGPAPAPPADGSLTGDWLNHDSLRGVSQITMRQEGTQLTATSLQPHVSFWAGASGSIDGKRGFLTFGDSALGNSEDSKVNNNRSFTVSADNSELYLERLSFDPPGFTQNFTRATAPFGPGGNCTGSTPCCVFKDDIDKVVKSPADSGVTTGRRAKLPARPPPYPNSTKVLGAVLHPKMESVPPISRWPSLLSDSVAALRIGINGDEFPITWDEDGNQYTGAGDNSQANETGSPLSFFQVKGGPTEMDCTYPPTHGNQPSPVCKNIHEMGVHVPVQGPDASKACPAWHSGIPNLKSSGVLSLDGVLYWAVSCFNYGDDAVFNRQRYGRKSSPLAQNSLFVCLAKPDKLAGREQRHGSSPPTIKVSHGT